MSLKPDPCLSEDGRYRFEVISSGVDVTAIHPSLPQSLAHNPMGEAARDWAELIAIGTHEHPEIIIHGIYQDAKFLGIATLMVIRSVDTRPYIGEFLSRLLKRCLAFDVGFLEVPLMNLPGILTVPGVDAQQRGEILLALREHLHRELVLDALFINTAGSISAIQQNPCFTGTLPMGFLPNVVLAFPYADIHAYWAQRGGKKNRKFKADVRALKAQGAEIKIHVDIAAIQQQVEVLYQNTLAAARQKPHFLQMPIAVNGEFFSRLLQLEHLRPRVICIEMADKIIASALVFKSGTTLYLKAVGLDYQFSRQTRAYFNLLYAVLDHASQEGCTQIDMGITSYRFKQWLGCTLQPATYACEVPKLMTRLLSRVLIPLIERRMGVHGQQHTVFKDL